MLIRQTDLFAELALRGAAGILPRKKAALRELPGAGHVSPLERKDTPVRSLDHDANTGAEDLTRFPLGSPSRRGFVSTT